MNTKQKLIYMVVGGIIGVVGTVIGMSVLSVSAARDEFGWIVRARGHDGVSRAGSQCGKNSGVVTVRGNDGKSGAAALCVNKYGNGVLSLWDKRRNRQ